MMTASHTKFDHDYDQADTARSNGAFSDRLKRKFNWQLSDDTICEIFFRHLSSAISDISTLANAKPFDVFQKGVSISAADLDLRTIERRYTGAAHFNASVYAKEVMKELFKWLIQGEDHTTINSRKTSPRGKFILAMDKACWAILTESDNQLRINSWIALSDIFLAVYSSLISEPRSARRWFKRVIFYSISVGLLPSETVHFRDQVDSAHRWIEKCITQERIFQVKDEIKRQINSLNSKMEQIASSAHRIISSLLMSTGLGDSTTHCSVMYSKKIQFNNLVWLSIQEVTGVLTIQRSEYVGDKGKLTPLGKDVSAFNNNIKLLHGRKEIKPSQESFIDLHSSDSNQVALLGNRENKSNDVESEESFNDFILMIKEGVFKNGKLIIEDGEKKKHVIESGFAPCFESDSTLLDQARFALIEFLKLLRAFINCLTRNQKYFEFFEKAGEVLAIALLAKTELCNAMEDESVALTTQFINAIEKFYKFRTQLSSSDSSTKKTLQPEYRSVSQQWAQIGGEVRELKQLNMGVIETTQLIRSKRLQVEIKIQNGDDSLRSSTEQLLQDQRLYNRKQLALGFDPLAKLTQMEEKNILDAASAFDSEVRHTQTPSNLRVEYNEPLRLTLVSDEIAPAHDEKKEHQTTSAVIAALNSPRVAPTSPSRVVVTPEDPVDSLLLSFTTTTEPREITKNNKILTDLKTKLGYPNDNSLNPSVFNVFDTYHLPKRSEKKSEEKASDNLFTSALFRDELNYQKTIATKLKSHWTHTWLNYLNPFTWIYRQWYGIPSLAVDRNNNRAARLAICEEMHSLFLRTLNNDGDGVINVEQMIAMHAELKELLSSQKSWFRSSFNSKLSLLLNQIEEEKNNAILKFNYLQSIQEYLNPENQQPSSCEKNIDNLKNDYNKLVRTNKHSLVARTLYIKNQIKDRLVFLVKTQHDAITAEIDNLSYRINRIDFSTRVSADQVTYQQQCADLQTKLVNVEKMVDDLKEIFEDDSINKLLHEKKVEVRSLFDKVVAKENEEQIKSDNKKNVVMLSEKLIEHMGVISTKFRIEDAKFIILDTINDKLVEFARNRLDFEDLQKELFPILSRINQNANLIFKESGSLIKEIWNRLKLETFQAASALKNSGPEEKLIPLRVAPTPQPTILDEEQKIKLCCILFIARKYVHHKLDGYVDHKKLDTDIDKVIDIIEKQAFPLDADQLNALWEKNIGVYQCSLVNDLKLTNILGVLARAYQCLHSIEGAPHNLKMYLNSLASDFEMNASRLNIQDNYAVVLRALIDLAFDAFEDKDKSLLLQKINNALSTNPGFFSLEAPAAKSAADATRLIESALDYVNGKPKRSQPTEHRTFRPHLRPGC